MTQTNAKLIKVYSSFHHTQQIALFEISLDKTYYSFILLYYSLSED